MCKDGKPCGDDKKSDLTDELKKELRENHARMVEKYGAEKVQAATAVNSLQDHLRRIVLEDTVSGRLKIASRIADCANSLASGLTTAEVAKTMSLVQKEVNAYLDKIVEREIGKSKDDLDKQFAADTAMAILMEALKDDAKSSDELRRERHKPDMVKEIERELEGAKSQAEANAIVRRVAAKHGATVIASGGSTAPGLGDGTIMMKGGDA